MSAYEISPLSRIYDRQGFDCGDERQNSFLKERALRHSRDGYSQTYVFTLPDRKQIVGFITLSMSAIDLPDLDSALIAHLPKHPMPVLLVGQLGVDAKFQGKGIGKRLLRFAGEQAILMSKKVGCFAVALDAQDEAVAVYYESFGFSRTQAGGLKLFLSLRLLERAINPEV